jgi:hypothetical protein
MKPREARQPTGRTFFSFSLEDGHAIDLDVERSGP